MATLEQGSEEIPMTPLTAYFKSCKLYHSSYLRWETPNLGIKEFHMKIAKMHLEVARAFLNVERRRTRQWK